MDAEELRLWVFQTTLFEAFSCEKTFELRKHKNTEHTKKRLKFFDHIRHIRTFKFLNKILRAFGVFVVKFILNY